MNRLDKFDCSASAIETVSSVTLDFNQKVALYKREMQRRAVDVMSALNARYADDTRLPAPAGYTMLSPDKKFEIAQ